MAAPSFNRTEPRHLEHVVWDTGASRALEVESIEPDRILPSIDTVLQEGLLR